LDQRRVPVARLGGPIDDDSIDDRRQRRAQPDGLRALPREVELDRVQSRVRVHLEHRPAERMRIGIIVRIPHDVGRQELPRLHDLTSQPTRRAAIPARPTPQAVPVAHRTVVRSRRPHQDGSTAASSTWIYSLFVFSAIWTNVPHIADAGSVLTNSWNTHVLGNGSNPPTGIVPKRPERHSVRI